MSSKIKFIDDARFMAASLPNLADNLVERIQKIKSKDCGCFLEYKSVNENSIKHKCTSCNKYYSNVIDEELKNDLRTNLIFLVMISTNLFCCLEQVLILMGTWMNWKGSRKYHCHKKKKKNFRAT